MTSNIYIIITIFIYSYICLLQIDFKNGHCTFQNISVSYDHLTLSLERYQGIIFLVSHRNLLCIFYMTAMQNIFCVAVFLHRSVHNFI